ncbi:glycosyltransferase [Moheibacter sediminis]|uniref:Glycosyltransferase involved in cell wall bisynthesis n=1 Tax=Moheibacter sediminis TaxID=1434700 RepID=A0A1W2AKW9_9FLAO|nr:glycosyltransferase family 2 protein [Moheibacter sediminis]SMC61347.1 Glycosyltransferase involved in cell wall bisynthesis [Moheibacter sediminis]
MLNIFIKSYNRAYYLDRCINSIFQNVSGNYTVIILDDGTPKKYLEKIQQIYPSVKVICSGNYEAKSISVEQNISNGKPIDSMKIPTDMWMEQVKKSDDYILMTEDDVWFTKKIDIDEVISSMESHKIQLVRLGWLGNFKDDYNLKIEKISNLLDRTVPKKLFTSNHFVMDVYMYNKYKAFSILKKLKLANKSTKLQYWAINSILMGLYHKDYWLYIWKDAYGKVDEKQQLRNAAVWFHKYKKNKNLIARTHQEYMKTTFKSSSTNSYHQYGFEFDVNYFNYTMNEAWLHGKFDSIQNYPQDFSTDYFERFFDEKLNKDEFRKWIEKFKLQYKNNGANVEE